MSVINNSASNFNKNVYFGTVSNILVAILSFVRNIILIRNINVSIELDTLLFSFSVIYLVTISTTKIFTNSVQPNISGENSIFVGASLLLGFVYILFMNGVLYFFLKNYLFIFTDNSEIIHSSNILLWQFILLSVFQSIYTFLSAIVSSTLGIKISLFIEVVQNLLVLLLLIFLGQEIYSILICFSGTFIFSTLFMLILIFKNVEIKIRLDNLFLAKVWYNLKFQFVNYFINFPISAFEKFILTALPSGSLSIYATVTKAISPINSVLINPSVLLVSFSNNRNRINKILLYRFLSMTTMYFPFFIVLGNYFSKLFSFVLPNLLNINSVSANLIISSFNILLWSLPSSVVYSALIKYLQAYNKSNFVFYFSLIGGIQISLLYFFTQNLGLNGILYSVLFNSFLLVVYLIIYFKISLKIDVINFKSIFEIRRIVYFLFALLYILIDILFDGDKHKFVYSSVCLFAYTFLILKMSFNHNEFFKNR